jgi:hypothetical protein
MRSGNTLYLVIGAMAVVIIIGGYYLYQEQHKSGISVEVGGKGISVETK